jgi:hypothetical protein
LQRLRQVHIGEGRDVLRDDGVDDPGFITLDVGGALQAGAEAGDDDLSDLGRLLWRLLRGGGRGRSQGESGDARAVSHLFDAIPEHYRSSPPAAS